MLRCVGPHTPEGVLEQHVAQAINNGLEVELSHRGVKHVIKERLAQQQHKWHGRQTAQDVGATVQLCVAVDGRSTANALPAMHSMHATTPPCC
jgi:hypothetical protein